MKPKYDYIGSVSHGTNQSKDIGPKLLHYLSGMKKLDRCHRKLVNKVNDAIYDLGMECTEDTVEYLLTVLDEYYSPPLMYFGVSPGNTSDYGFWLYDDWDLYLKEEGGIKVNNISDIPPDHVGLVAVVNDHGNIDLFDRGPNHRYRLLWSVV